ncbi:MAG: helix-turn-helix domain-containing protein [Candidatus Acidiferrales bacterium]
MNKKSKLQHTALPRGTQTLADFQQIRALAHPLRLRILGLLAREPRTTKQVAELLGENHTKLYHHVQELERAKVIRLTETRQKRGTVEKYYQATAALFRAAPSLLSPARTAVEKPSELEAMLNALLDAARADVLALAQRDGLQQGSRKGLIGARLLLKGSRVKALKAVRRQISRSINALIAQESRERARKRRAEQDDKRMLALTILLLPTDGI